MKKKSDMKPTPNPDTVPAGVNPETGFRNSTKTKYMSSAAMKGKDNAKIKRAALQKMLKNRIPASPTR